VYFDVSVCTHVRDVTVTFSQSIRVKLVQNSSTVERRFSSWIGGSILASLVSLYTAIDHSY